MADYWAKFEALATKRDIGAMLNTMQGQIKTLQDTPAGSASFATLSGSPSDNTNLQAALDAKLTKGTATATQIDTHLADTSNPHSVTKAQIGLGNVVNTDTTNPANIVQDSTHRFVTDTEKATWNAGGGGSEVIYGNPPAANTFSQIHFTLSSGSASLAAEGAGLLFTQTGNNSTSARDMSWAVQAIPGSGAYKLIVGMKLLMSAIPYTQAGLVITDGNGATPKGIEFILAGRLQSETGPRIEYIYENSPTSFNAETWEYIPCALGNKFWLQIEDDRSSYLTFSFSTDGANFVPAFLSVGRTAFLTPAYIGIHLGQQAIGSGGGVAVPTNKTRSLMHIFDWYLGA